MAPGRALILTLALAACGTPAPSPTASSAPTSQPGSPPAASASSTTATSTATSTATPQPAPGRPYHANTILAAMRESRRPGGVPDQLETDAIAGAVARRIWTYDGQPWQTLAIGGACGPVSCSLEVAGTPANAAGADLYSLSVVRGTAEVTLLAADLHGYPAALDAELDRTVRELLPGGRLAGVTLAGAEWLPPPDAGRFRVAYRAGGEEESGGLDLLLDLAARRIVEMRPVR
jgi:hypothetical protein